MAPQYRPVSVSLNGLPPEVFGAPKDFTFMDAMKEEEMLQNAQQSNDANQIILQQKKGIIDALRQKYAGADPSTFDPAEALSIAKRAAMGTGDIGTMLDIRRAERSYANGDRQLTDEEAAQLDMPPGTTLSVARAILRNKDLEQEQQRFEDPTRVLNRELDATLKGQRATGTSFQKVSDTELGKLENADGSLQSIGEIKGLLNQVQPGALSALAAGQVTDLYKDPGSPAYRMYARLELLKKQVARMNDSGALTELDVSMFQPLTVGSPIFDDKNSLAQRMQDLEGYIRGKQQSIITRNEQGYRNMDRFKDSLESVGSAGGSSAPSQSGGLPRNSDGTPLTREQFYSQRGR